MEDQIADLINNLNPGLTAKDYTLNSPLIRDRVDAVLLKLQTGQTTTQFAQNKQLFQCVELLKTHVTQVDKLIGQGCKAWTTFTSGRLKRSIKANHKLVSSRRCSRKTGRQCRMLQRSLPRSGSPPQGPISIATS